jgi:hypothetical protein
MYDADGGVIWAPVYIDGGLADPPPATVCKTDAGCLVPARFDGGWVLVPETP